MTSMAKKLSASALALVAAAGVSTASAYEAGDVIVRAGAAMVDPDGGSDVVRLNGAPLVGTEVDVQDDTQLGLTIGYMVNENFGIELLLATPFSHDVEANQTLGTILGGQSAGRKHPVPGPRYHLHSH